jgi:hypothetical protein
MQIFHRNRLMAEKAAGRRSTESRGRRVRRFKSYFCRDVFIAELTDENYAALYGFAVFHEYRLDTEVNHG